MNEYTVVVALLMVVVFRWGIGFGQEKKDRREQAFKDHASNLSQMANAILSGLGESHLRWLADCSSVNNAPLTKEEREDIAGHVENMVALANHVAESRTSVFDLIKGLDPDNKK